MQIVSSLFILLCAISFCVGREYPVGLTRENTKAVKGLLALSIILCHLSSHTSYHLPFFSFSAMGPTGVGCFFFLSGFGCAVSAKKKSYFKWFLRRHTEKILIPYAVMLALWLLVFQCGFHEPVLVLARSFSSGNPVSNSWYVFASMYCYLLFWFSYRRKRKTSFLLIIIGLIVWIALTAYVLSWDWWYRTIICFAAGIVWGTNYENISLFVRAHFRFFFLFALLFYALAYCSPVVLNGKIASEVVWLINDSSMGFFGALLLAVAMKRFSLVNKGTMFLGEISYELYLFHGLLIHLSERMLRGGIQLQPRVAQELLSLLIVCSSIGIAVLFHAINKKLIAYAQLRRVTYAEGKHRRTCI